MIQYPFIQLIRLGLDLEDCGAFPLLDDAAWDRIYKLSKKQSVIAVVCRGIMRLPVEVQPPQMIKIRFAMTSERIAEQNRRFDGCSERFCSEVSELGLSPCLLKGQGLAKLYPEEGIRQCGDIDVWVYGPRREVLRRLRSRWKTGKVFYHHVDVDVFGGKPEVEVHFTPSWMNNPFANRRMQRYFSSQAAIQSSNRPDSYNYSVPTISFNLLFNLSHIYRHVLFEGVGLRQFIDYCLLLENSTAAEREEAMRLVCSFGMGNFAGALNYAIRELFGVEDKLLPVAPDMRRGKALLDEIRRGGNFGRYDRRNAGIAKAGAFKRFYKRMRRLSDFLLAYPSEVLWAPYFKIRQRIWRIFVER